MKITRFSCVPLMVGLVVGLAALWASAAPAIGNGNSALGGWYVQDNWLGCTSQLSLVCETTDGCYPLDRKGTSYPPG